MICDLYALNAAFFFNFPDSALFQGFMGLLMSFRQIVYSQAFNDEKLIFLLYGTSCCFDV